MRTARERQRTLLGTWTGRLHSDDTGAVLIIVALSMLLLLGIAALTIDGGRGLNEERNTQNAADHAALAAAWASCNGSDPQTAGIASAIANGFDNNGATNTVTITDLGSGRFGAVISSTVDGTFSKAIGTETVTARSEAVATCDINVGLGGFALFAGADACGPTELDLTGSSQTINGGIHSNDQLKISGNAATPSQIFGPVTAVTTVQHSGVDFYDTAGNPSSPTQGVSYIGYPVEYKISWYAPGGGEAFAAGADYTAFPGDKDWSNETISRGLYYVDGDVSLHDVTGEGVTIVATGQIRITGTNAVNTYHPVNNPAGSEPYDQSGLALFSTYQNESASCNRNAIIWSGSSHNWGGIQYAPYSNVDMSGADNSAFNGSIIAYNINLSGAGIQISYQDDHEGTPFTIINLEE